MRGLWRSALGDLGSLPIFVLMVASVLLFSWLSTVWNRYVLLERYPNGIVPPFEPAFVFATFLKFVWLAIIAMVIMMPAVAIILPFLVDGGGQLQLISWIAAAYGTFALYILTRLSLVLPAAAVGMSMTIGQSFRHTRGRSGAIVLFIVFTGVLGLVSGLLPLPAVMGNFLAITIAWFVTILTISFVTTLYGVTVEGRSLA